MANKNIDAKLLPEKKILTIMYAVLENNYLTINFKIFTKQKKLKDNGILSMSKVYFIINFYFIT